MPTSTTGLVKVNFSGGVVLLKCPAFCQDEVISPEKAYMNRRQAQAAGKK